MKHFSTLLSSLTRLKCGCKCYHVYKMPEISSYELAQNLVNNIIYNRDGVVIVNKPYGISFSSLPPSSANSDFQVSFLTLEPHLKRLLGCDQLFVTKTPEKYETGVAMLCTSEGLQKTVKGRLSTMRAQREMMDEHLAVTLGKPRKGTLDAGLTLATAEGTKQKKVVFVKNWSQGAVKRGVVKRVKLRLDDLEAVSADASLVRVLSSRSKWHCVRLFLADHHLSPVLGDDLFGSRVSTVLKSPVRLDPFSPAASHPQRLSSEVASMLKVGGRMDIKIPVHLHLATLRVQHFPRRGEESRWSAHPPPWFTWTCSRLGLISQPPSLLEAAEF